MIAPAAFFHFLRAGVTLASPAQLFVTLVVSVSVSPPSPLVAACVACLHVARSGSGGVPSSLTCWFQKSSTAESEALWRRCDNGVSRKQGLTRSYHIGSFAHGWDAHAHLEDFVVEVGQLLHEDLFIDVAMLICNSGL
jgi:hypothetical protein